MTLVEKIRALANNEGMNLPELEIKLGLGNGTISRWNKSKPNTDKLIIIADYFNVSTDYLLGRELNEKDEKDIAKDLNTALNQLEKSQDGLMFDGEPLDDETRELLKISLENSMRLAKQIAKKYTPNKYKK